MKLSDGVKTILLGHLIGFLSVVYVWFCVDFIGDRVGQRLLLSLGVGLGWGSAYLSYIINILHKKRNGGDNESK